MKLIFLGSGGGRFVTMTQKLATGGTIIEMDGEMIHYDPGPGALVHAKEYGIDLRKLTGIIISHAHPDHYTDAEVVSIAMTRGAKQKRGFFLSNEYVFKGSNDGKYRPAISQYSLDYVKFHRIMNPGDSVNINKLKITAVHASHGDPKALGFVLKGSVKLGLTGDGEYYNSMAANYKGCDYLIINCLRPRTETWPRHMNADGAKRLIEGVQPKAAILKDFGMKMLGGVAEKEAKWIEGSTGVKTIAAKDGMRIDSQSLSTS